MFTDINFWGHLLSPKFTSYRPSMHCNFYFQPGNKAVEIKFLFLSAFWGSNCSVIEPLRIPVLIFPPFHVLLQAFNKRYMNSELFCVSVMATIRRFLNITLLWSLAWKPPLLLSVWLWEHSHKQFHDPHQ